MERVSDDLLSYKIELYEQGLATMEQEIAQSPKEGVERLMQEVQKNISALLELQERRNADTNAQR